MQTIVSEREELRSRVIERSILSKDQKDSLTLDLFKFQYKYNKTYYEYVNLLNLKPENVTTVSQIPFLPIQFFKNFIIKAGSWNEELVFESSGTTRSISSKHYVRDSNWYNTCAFDGFKSFYKDPESISFLALLPSYLERGNSSLVAMIDYFIQNSNQKSSGFYLADFESLANQLKENEQSGIRTLLIGVSYALLDFAESFPMELKNTNIIETGGMKGRRKELPKTEIHQILKGSFQLDQIHSEYGMTELFAQAYSTQDGLFFPTYYMDVHISELNDPLTLLGYGRTGGINIIDYSNIDTCSFIATEDMGKKYEDGSFELLGRKDVADMRGCNLMVDDILK